ncbi:MAG: hypothetical protein KAT70_04380 [Thermoplasmata archaeon]|nr:hypothetical protein [Thermoplasmata archaeon]
MIEIIAATGCKGMDFRTVIKGKTIIIGPNGSGKTAMAVAAMIAIQGYVPGVPKKPGALLDTFGDGKRMMCSVVISGILFERKYSKSKKGATSQRCQIDSKGVKPEAYAIALGAAGAPAVFDLAHFLGLSDAKQIDELFTRFPPAGDVDQIAKDLDKAKDNLNTLRSDEGELEATAKRLSKRRTDAAELPAGTMAETSNEIDRTEAELTLARENLRKAEIEEAKEEGKRIAEEATKKAAERKEVEEEPPHPAGDPPSDHHWGISGSDSGASGGVVSKDVKAPHIIPESRPATEAMAGSDDTFSRPGQQLIDRLEWVIAKLRETGDTAGCNTCPMLMVATKELRRIQRGE